MVKTEACVLVVATGLLFLTAVNTGSGTASRSQWPSPPHYLHVVCYVGTWANYRPSPANFNIPDIDPSLCSHLIYSFAGIDEKTNTIMSLDTWTDLDPADGGRGFYRQMTGLRKDHPHLKVLLAVGGFNEGSLKFSEMASTGARRRIFIRSAVEFVNKYEFDGLDIDWEFPTKNGGAPEDRENFVALVKEMRAEFNKHNLMVTSAFHAGVDTMEAAYDLPALVDHLDMFNIMAYDYHGSWDKRTGANAPLYAQDDKWSIVDTLEYIKNQGVPMEKVVLGLGMYGHTFILDDPTAEGSDKLGAPCSDVGFSGDFTKQDGFMGYNEICLEFTDAQWKRYWDNDTGTPYLINKEKVVSFDDEESIRLKVDYSVRLYVGGLMLWSIDTDDFQGDCGGVKFPLLTKINEVIVETLEDMGIDPTPTTTTISTTPTTSTTPGSTTTDASAGWTKPPHDLKMVCYVSTWANYRVEPAAFYIQDIQPSLCTHLIYAFAGLDNQTFAIKSLDPYTDIDRNGFKLMTGLKATYPHLKVLLAIGGYNEGSKSYSQLAASTIKRKVFINSVLTMLKQYDFDGLDFDWEFPGERGGVPEDRENFVILIKELRAEFDKEGLLLTAALHAAPVTMNTAYDLPGLSSHLHLLHIMAYDYHGAFDGKTGANAPLFNQTDGFSLLDTLEYLQEKGAAMDKVVMGLPMYGHTFILLDPGAEGSDQLGAPSDTVGFPGPYTKQDGFMGYHEICSELADPSWTQLWDEATGTPYAINGDQVISYDDEVSLTMKVNHTVQYGIAGFMTWSIDTDDFQGECGDKRYPLLKRINLAVLDADLPTTTVDPSSTTETSSLYPPTTDPSDAWDKPPHDMYMMCYVSTWAMYRKEPAAFITPHINPRLCTHLIYAFAGLVNSTNIASIDPNADMDPPDGKGGFKNMTSLRKDFPHLKILLAIGGYNEGSEKYSELAASPENRQIFIDSVIRFLLKYNFDGLDFDWEYPGLRGGVPEDKENFVLLVQELRTALDRYEMTLTAALHAAPSVMETAYDLPRLAEHLHLFHIMAYDYHGPYDLVTGPNAPLRSASDNLSVEATLNYLSENGAPLEMVILGLPMYGNTFVLTNPGAEGSDELGAPCKEAGFPGFFTEQNGFMGYNEICLELTDPKWVSYWDNISATPYVIQAEKVISYDNEKSIAEKIEFAIGQGVGGFMMWSIDTDDFQGACGGGQYPLLKTINYAVVETLNALASTTTTTTTTTTTPTPTPTPTTTGDSSGNSTTSVDPGSSSSPPPSTTPPPTTTTKTSVTTVGSETTTPGAAATVRLSSILLAIASALALCINTPPRG